MPLHIRILYLLLISNVTLRFFTNAFGLLPRVLNLLDVFITIALCIVSFTTRRDPGSARSPFQYVGNRLIAFNLVLCLGAMLNFSSLYVPAAIAQIIMLSEPFLLFAALMKMPMNLPQVRSFEKLLRRLIILEFVVGIIQFPIYLATGESEAIIGTFSGNAEQYTGFLVLGVAYYLGRRSIDASKKGKYSAIIVGLLILNIFVDNKASWLGTVAALYFLLTNLGSLSGSRTKHTLTFAALLVAGFIVAATTSKSFYKFDVLGSAWDTGNVWNLGKIKAYGDVFTAFEEYPHMTLIGSGPGTFYSRAAQQFYLVGVNLYSNPSEYRRTIKTRTSNSMGGVIDPTTTVDPFYKRFYINSKIYSIGSDQVDSPFASYAGILGEAGMLGFIIYLSVYVAISRRLRVYWTRFRDDPNIFPLITASTGFLIYTATVSLYNPWLETGRVTTILWGLIAVVCHYGEKHLNEKDKTEAVDNRFTSSTFNRPKYRYAKVVAGRQPEKRF